MNKISLSLTVVAGLFLLALTSCSSQDSLDASTYTCAFTASGGEKTIGIGTSESAWKAELIGENADRFTISQDGNKLKVTASANYTEHSLSAEVRLKAGSGTAIVYVTQEGTFTPPITVYPPVESHYFNYRDDSFTFQVQSGMLWSASSDQEWCIVVFDPGTGMLSVSATTNTSLQSRSAIVTISAGEGANMISRPIEFIQYSRSEEPYSSLIGEWELYCSKWSLGEDTFGYGTYNTWRIEEREYNRSYLVREMMGEGTRYELNYNKIDDIIECPLGWTLGQNGGTYFFLLAFAPSGGLSGGSVNGYISEDRNEISLEGLADGYSMGMIGYSDGSYFKFNDIYYPESNDLVLKRKTAAPASVGESTDPQADMASGFKVEDDCNLSLTKEMKRFK